LKYRIVMFDGCYRIQTRHWWWPFWKIAHDQMGFMLVCATFEHAHTYIEQTRAYRKQKPTVVWTE
jgi:hypothetical protein